MAITPSSTNVTSPWIEQESKIEDFRAIYAKQCDVTLHNGNKPISCNGLLRMLDFFHHVIEQKEEANISGGHSIWLRSFLRIF